MRRLISVVLCALLAISILFIGFASSNLLFFHIPGSSATYDCDDATLQMVNKLESIGVRAIPVSGNLKMTGEKPLEINHVWVIVKLPLDIPLAFDWGQPALDSQHYEYYEISYDQLIYFVEQDRSLNKIPAQ